MKNQRKWISAAFSTSTLAGENILPLLKYMVLSDATFLKHRKTLFWFMGLLGVCSLASLSGGLWIEFSKEITFSWYLLKTGTYKSFPLHYAIIVNGIGGGICFMTCCIAVMWLICHPVGLIITTSVTSAIWALFTLVYNFGANIVYEDQLEDIMVLEMQKSKFSGISPIWRTSQNFFKCCGINSFKNWRFTFPFPQDYKSAALYPSSCCAHNRPWRCDEQRVHESKVWLIGCLEPESFSIMSTSYTALLVSTLQFIFTAFAITTLVKLYCRLRYLKKQTIKILMSENILCIARTNEEVCTNKNAEVDATAKASDKENQVYQMKKSFTI